MSDKVTPDMIDEELVKKYAIFVAEFMSYAPAQYYEGFVAATLAAIANDPVELSEEDAESIQDDWTRINALRPKTFWPKVLIEYQRKAYLKKQPQYPKELQNLMTNYGYEGVLKQAYEIGLREGKKG